MYLFSLLFSRFRCLFVKADVLFFFSALFHWKVLFFSVLKNLFDCSILEDIYAPTDCFISLGIIETLTASVWYLTGCVEVKL